MKHLRKDLEKCRRGPVNNQSVGRMELLKFRLERLEEQEHIYWKQRAKVHRLEKGDRNTRFFHHYATERRRASRIKRLIMDDGHVVENEEELQQLISNFYEHLFSSSAGDRVQELLQFSPR